MKISIIGSLISTPSYEEWEQFMLCECASRDVSEFVITSSPSVLNSYVTRFCDINNIQFNVVGFDSSLPKDKAKKMRNIKLIDKSDFIFLFCSNDLETKKYNTVSYKKANINALLYL